MRWYRGLFSPSEFNFRGCFFIPLRKKKGEIMLEKILLIVIFAVITAVVGVYYNRHSQSVEGFVLGGREVGPWLTAFAYGTSYFSSVV